MDMRKSIDGLAAYVAAGLGREPCDGAIYVFCNRGRDKLKILYWETNGFCLWYKRLEKERFQVSLRGDVLELTSKQLRWLQEGLDYQNLKGHKEVNFQRFS